MTDQLIERFGFRSMIDAKYQSWGAFTVQLFNDKISQEYDRVDFIFDLDEGNERGYTQIDIEDDLSLESAYFGRLIKQTIIHLPKKDNLESKFNAIKDVLSGFYTKMEVNKLSEPILVIHEICDDNRINAYYTWQYR